MRREYLRHAPWTNALPLVVLWRTAAAACATAANEPANAAHIMRLQPPVLAAPNHFGSLVIYKHVKQRLSATVRSPGTAGLRSTVNCAPPRQAAQTAQALAPAAAGRCVRQRVSTAQRCTALQYGLGGCMRGCARLPAPRQAGWAYLSRNREPTP